jgi:NAD(P)-dependent dehydrogenase (short-subunit alcohol dehydrogenase family)
MPDGARIVNISSGLTRTANPDQLVYAMTKGAVEQLTLHLARHLAPRGITVNTVAPGITNNGGAIFAIPEAVEAMAQLSAFKRVGEADDVADVVTFLATHETRWITGGLHRRHRRHPARLTPAAHRPPTAHDRQRKQGAHGSR